MRAPCTAIAVPLVLSAVLAGCRDFRPNDARSADHALLRADGRRNGGEGAVSARAINPELILGSDGTVPRTSLSFVAEEADSLPLMASWAEIPVSEILRMNDGFGRQPFGPGRSVTLALAPVDAARFNALRDVHLDKWRHREDAGQVPVDVVEHVMAKDETLADLLERYPTTEDLLARENGDLTLTVLREGRRVRVPVLAQVARPAPEPAPAVDSGAPAPAPAARKAGPAEGAGADPASAVDRDPHRDGKGASGAAGVAPRPGTATPRPGDRGTGVPAPRRR